MLTIDHVSKQFDDRLILEDVSFSIKEGDYVTLVGRSGCGKTTLLNIATGMMRPSSGQVLWNGTDVYALSENKRTQLRGKEIGFMTCQNALLENLTVYENIKYTLLLNHLSVQKDKIKDVLLGLHIYTVCHSYPAELSSGEYRRALFARTLCMNPTLFVLDEPTSNLDEDSKNLIIQAIDQIGKDKAVLVATHDPKLMKGRIIPPSENA